MVYAVFSDRRGNIFEDQRLGLMGRLGRHLVRLRESDLIELPEGSDFFFMPDDRMVGWDLKQDQPKITGKNPVAVFLPPGYTRTYLPAAVRSPAGNILPQWAYTACGFLEDRMVAAAIQTDQNPFWDPLLVDPDEVRSKASQRRDRMPRNRIVNQLWTCAVQHGCMSARNYFLERHEAAIPVSPACNASCVGCLSWQPEESCVPSHDRITFLPSVEEIVEIAVPHLEGGGQRIVSFGQGCEGDPLLAAGTIEEAIREIRSKTQAGTLNMNTNGSLPEAFERLCQAGLDSVRISTNSAVPETYVKYYRPAGYDFDAVRKSMEIAKKNGLFLSINLLTFPGITDEKNEANTILTLCRESKVDLVQVRNLNIDPELYLDLFPDLQESECIGIRSLVEELAKIHGLAVGNFNRPKEQWNLTKGHPALQDCPDA